MDMPWVLGPSMVTRSGLGVSRVMCCRERVTSLVWPLETGHPSPQPVRVSVLTLAVASFIAECNQQGFVKINRHQIISGGNRNIKVHITVTFLHFICQVFWITFVCIEFLVF